ncbi:cupin domain-containing protein [Cyanobium sp. Morenito 9A2]|uniref:cupin domain-containing protein n=1 Tax=Cyanobium sp. Morenito 9A2 TaxID=2823718 RepID=UPI0020CED7FE|nr:cupin domain-containing protein [Cyanobium sp. Morenito 9A2]MCP9848584.1 cupin domain-containing protein [Cyanobium sp. Morenito 9A2]
MKELIHKLALAPHPEGGFYREIHRSELRVRRADGAERAALTLIDYLLPAGACSRWHRLHQAEETWHHAGGSPLELWRLAPEGPQPQRLWLGPLDPQRPEQRPLQRIPPGWWQAARSGGPWSLVNCCVAPGFEFSDFELLSDQPTKCHPAGALQELL